MYRKGCMNIVSREKLLVHMPTACVHSPLKVDLRFNTLKLR